MGGGGPGASTCRQVASHPAAASLHNCDPPHALCRECRVTPEPGAPSDGERAAVLQRQGLLSVPQLLDACVLYGPSNPQLAQRLAQQVQH